MKYLWCFIVGVFSFSTVAQAEGCILAGQATQLQGKISIETFPGRPNYESIKDGDEPEVYWILTTKKPYCGQGVGFNDEGQEITQIEKNQTRFQLILTPEQYKQWKALLPNNVTVEGSMMMAHTGHHHTAMLLQVTNMKGAK
ncbi:DUF4431 domain-containing protein [Legionella waltersii]|uniref:DUF4431 domain-containing protein n=1 Tax=Legionella waltersii TaxID=66969 RepID=A0A0W1A707_9GAMM|nr:DUF4431 domain-containing protein [Legionella waltersii]KTD77164.1 hypothetical protein Lwal_1941 [Legionella waltersii]SNV11376.1 Uncharacterised protein [Legionella waltersii]